MSPLISVLRARRQSKFHEALRVAADTKRILLSVAAPPSATTQRKSAGRVVELGIADAAAG
jgi:hypothetical protein